MLVGNVGWKKCWLNIWLDKMLVNGCEIIGEKIVASNLPLRLITTITHTIIYIHREYRHRIVRSFKLKFNYMGIFTTKCMFRGILGVGFSTEKDGQGGEYPVNLPTYCNPNH